MARMSLLNHPWSRFTLWDVAILEYHSVVACGLTQDGQRKALSQLPPRREANTKMNQRTWT